MSAVPDTGNRKPRPFTKQVGAVITGEYTKVDLTQADLARASGEPVTTVQRVLAGTAPLTVERLELWCDLIGVSPGAVLDEALDRFGGIRKLREQVPSHLVSEAPTTNVTHIQEGKRGRSKEEIDRIIAGDKQYVADEFDPKGTEPDFD